MQTATKNSFFLTSSFSFKVLAGLQTASEQGEFYQQILKGLVKGIYTEQAFNSMGDRLVALAEYVYDFRKFDALEQVSHFLLNWPSNEYRDLGLYYKALCLRQRTQFTESSTMLDGLVEKLRPKFRAKALLAMAANCYRSSDFKSALSLSIEASRAATYHDCYDPQTFITSQRNIAVHKSFDGDHRFALANLEKILPLVRSVSRWKPYLYYEHLNSLAVELGEVGRLKEAQNACRAVLASSYSSAYPEWRETHDELALRGRRASRSVVSFAQRALNKVNVLSLPLPVDDDKQVSVESAPQHSTNSARILDYVDWKKKMVKEPNGNQKDDKISEDLDDMTNKDLLVEIVQRTSKKGMSEKKLRKILEYVMEVEPEPED